MSMASGTIDPPGQRAGVAGRQIVAARQHRDTGARGGRAFEHAIGQRAAGVARHHDVAWPKVDVLDGDLRHVVTRPAILGQASASARCSFALDGGITVSTASAFGEESSRSSRRCASSPWPAARSTMRPPRNRRRTRRATSHASYSSLRGRHPAWHTARPTRAKRLVPAKRSRSRSVRRPLEEGENTTTSLRIPVAMLSSTAAAPRRWPARGVRDEGFDLRGRHGAHRSTRFPPAREDGQRRDRLDAEA